jgi:electron transfer flavoprotein alpha subunit
MAEVLVLVDHVDGEVKKVTLELLTAARALGEPSAVVVGPTGTAAKAKEALASHGAAKVYVAEGDDAANYLVTPKVDVLAALAQQASPAAVLVTASGEGKEVAARLAVRLGSGLIYDAVGVNGDGVIDQSIFGGAFSVKSKASKGVPVVSIRPGAVEAEPAEGAAAEETVEIPATDAAKATKITGVEPVTGGDRPELTEASIVVSGGRGVASADNFSIIEALADSLGAAVGASGSLLTAMIVFDVCMPARCWIAPEMPSAMYSCGDTVLPVWPTWNCAG